MILNGKQVKTNRLTSQAVFSCLKQKELITVTKKINALRALYVAPGGNAADDNIAVLHSFPKQKCHSTPESIFGNTMAQILVCMRYIPHKISYGQSISTIIF